MFIYLIIGGVVGFFVGRATKGGFAAERKSEELNEMREESKEALGERTEKRKEKILGLMQNKRGKNAELTQKIESDEKLAVCDIVVDRTPGVTSEEVEKLLDVSNGTARKYLNELEDEGKIKQMGKTGKGVYYARV